MEVSMISPAPHAAASRAQRIASRPVRVRPPATNTSKPPFLRRASMATTTACEPKRAAIFPISDGSFTAAELIAILSAPASNTASASASSRIPPPTVNGMNKRRAVRETTSSIVLRLSLVAVISNDLVRAIAGVSGSTVRGVAGVAQIHELHAFHDPAVVHIETGDDALGQH